MSPPNSHSLPSSTPPHHCPHKELLRRVTDCVHEGASLLAAARAGAFSRAAARALLSRAAAQRRALEEAAAEARSAFALLEARGVAPAEEDRALLAGLDAAHAARDALEADLAAAVAPAAAEGSAAGGGGLGAQFM